MHGREEVQFHLPALARLFHPFLAFQVAHHQFLIGFDDGVVYQTMEETAKIGPPGIVAIHPENWQIGRIFEKRLIEAGAKGYQTRGRPPPFSFCR